MRDLAHAHIIALTDPKIQGFNGRYLMSTKSLWFSEIVNALRARRSELGVGRIKTRKMGKMGITFAALIINQSLKEILPFVEQQLEIRTAGELVEAMTGHDYITIEDSLFDMAMRLVELEREHLN